MKLQFFLKENMNLECCYFCNQWLDKDAICHERKEVDTCEVIDDTMRPILIEWYDYTHNPDGSLNQTPPDHEAQKPEMDRQLKQIRELRSDVEKRTKAISKTTKEKVCCVVSGCTKEAEYFSPDDWCEEHWDIWWNWSPTEPEPEWMKKENG